MGDMSQGRWDNPDPRIKWAMDIFDQEGEVFDSELGRLTVPIAMGLLPLGALTFYNGANKLPLKTGQVCNLALVPLGFMFGQWLFKKNLEVRAERNAVLKHYIMSYPERFPEPKRVKYIDYITYWRPIR